MKGNCKKQEQMLPRVFTDLKSTSKTDVCFAVFILSTWLLCNEIQLGKNNYFKQAESL